MAQKKITDLTLRDDVSSDLNLPSDDGIQSYRVTAAQIKNFVLANGNILLAMLDTDIFHGLSAVTPADDDYFPIVDTSDSNLTKKSLVSSFRRSVYRAVTTTDTPSITDEFLACSGSAFTVTLFTAVGNLGKKITIKKTDATLANQITIEGNGSETIDGVLNIVLGKHNETVTLISDNANWQILEWYGKTGLVAQWTIPVTTNLEWTNTGTTLDAFGSDAQCPDWTIANNPGPGTALATNSDLPQVTINSLPAGTYRVEAAVAIGPSGSGYVACVALNDGTNTSPPACAYGSSNFITVSGVFTYTSSGNRTFALWGSASTGTITLWCADSNESIRFSIYRIS